MKNKENKKLVRYRIVTFKKLDKIFYRVEHLNPPTKFLWFYLTNEWEIYEYLVWTGCSFENIKAVFTDKNLAIEIKEECEKFQKKRLKELEIRNADEIIISIEE